MGRFCNLCAKSMQWSKIGLLIWHCNWMRFEQRCNLRDQIYWVRGHPALLAPPPRLKHRAFGATLGRETKSKPLRNEPDCQVAKETAPKPLNVGQKCEHPQGSLPAFKTNEIRKKGRNQIKMELNDLFKKHFEQICQLGTVSFRFWGQGLELQ